MEWDRYSQDKTLLSIVSPHVFSTRIDFVLLMVRVISEVKPLPALSVTPANSSVSLSGNYTLAMVDADIVGTDESKGQTRHWLVNDVTVSGQ